jgi:transglutaminase-like putative cysteine protease
MMVLGGSGGFIIHLGLSQAHSALEEQFPTWLLAWFEPQPNPYYRSTALGSIGSLKLSNRIVLRVTPIGQGAAPELLRMASYNLFEKNVWFTSSNAFKTLAKHPSLSTWNIRPFPKENGNTVTISQQVGNDKTLLSLPLGAYQIRSLEANRIERNSLGTIQATNVPATLHYRVAYYSAAEKLSPVTDDLRVPVGYDKPLADIATALGLRQLPVQQIPKKLQTYFNEQFTYSLALKTRDRSLPPLIDFLRNTRSGHCEYFASATVLLLRQVGIPARYASGFSVQEYSSLEDRFIVRKRHAHAWAIAYLDGRWQNVDTTPAIWREVDAQQNSLLTGLYDVLSWGWLQIQQWLTKQEEETGGNPLAWLPLALGLLLVEPLCRQLAGRWQRRQIETPPGSTLQGPGRDSECYRIADWCLSQGLERAPGETLERWLKGNASADTNSDALLTQILALHERYRFDPAGISPAERAKLRALVDAWFEKRTKQQNPLRNVISRMALLTLFALIILFVVATPG